MKKRTLTSEQLKKEPWSLWNSFVDILIMEEYNDLSEKQKLASLLLWYDSEVHNGGHLQFFLNQGKKRTKLTLSALKKLDMTSYYQNLKLGFTAYQTFENNDIRSRENYIDLAIEDPLEEMDNRYFDISPTIIQILEQFLKDNLNEFIDIQ